MFATAAWAGALLAHHGGLLGLAALGAAGAVVHLGAGVLASAPRATRPSVWRRLLAAALLLALAVGAGALLRERAHTQEPLRGWATERASVDLTARVTSDPRRISGLWGDQILVRVRSVEVRARGETYRVGAPLLVLGELDWEQVPLGATVRTSGRLAEADDPALAALVTGADAPETVAEPDVWWRGADRVRASIRDSVRGRPVEQRALVPALVDGDDAALPGELEDQFRDVGLTHLTAVSGTNLTLIVGCLLLAARGIGVRGRWLYLVGLAGIVGFILLARTEPSVVRAAAMGTVGLFALGTDGRRRGLRALGIGVVGLLLIAPGLAVTPGFALSVLATSGIVVLVPGLQAAMARWLPTPLAAAVAVPLAAQVACTPVIAALSGEVSMVAVVANLLAGPAVGPATVLGLLGGLVGLVVPWAGRVLGTLAAWCVAWIVEVAQRGAAFPGAAVGWGSGTVAVALLTLVCVALAFAMPRVLASRRLGALSMVATVLIVTGVPGCARLPSPGLPGWMGGSGWAGGPPAGWVMVACDVGQGDAVVLSAGDGVGVVVDAGPDPAAIDACLDLLGVEEVPLVVLTHLHADHIDGLAGVLAGRRVGAIETTAVLDPPSGAAEVDEIAREAGVPVRIAPYGHTRSLGTLTWQVVAPDESAPVPGAGDGSSANDASVVLLVESHGLRLLLTGDLEPPGQAQLGSTLPDLDVDVLKVPHHGSLHQDHPWLTSLRPEFAVISAGADNDYGHPAPETLATLEDAGSEIGRTDRQGHVAIVVDGAQPSLVAAGQ